MIVISGPGSQFYRTTAQERGFKGSVPVKSFPSGAGPYGVLGMVGNVREWVEDWYEEDYFSRSPDRNPTGPGSGTLKVLRGHTWEARSPYGSCTFRRMTYPDGAYDTIGFRCAADGLSPQ